MMRRAARIAWLVAFWALVQSAPTFAQATTADLVGRVTDDSGAVLPGATVTITHTGTGQVRTQVASDTGDYAFNLLPIGTYDITIELQGFKTQTARMALASGDRARVDGKLEVGAVTETVTVTADAPLLQTDSANVSSLWTDKLVQELPVQERNVYRFVQLVPGADTRKDAAGDDGALRPTDAPLSFPRALVVGSSSGPPRGPTWRILPVLRFSYRRRPTSPSDLEAFSAPPAVERHT